jgi:hypothetical protein
MEDSVGTKGLIVHHQLAYVGNASNKSLYITNYETFVHSYCSNCPRQLQVIEHRIQSLYTLLG